MELTLLLSPGDASRPPRLPVVRPVRAGRSRGQAVRIVWHDTLDRALASDGLALAEQRGAWRLESHRPAATEPWPPATDHRLIEEAARLDAFDHELPDAMTPVAAFEGRRTIYPLTFDGEPMAMTILTGVLRAVAAEQPTARLILEGPDNAVKTLALALADALPIGVPTQSLASEALCLADGGAPSPRRDGAPELPRDGMSVDQAFAHIIGHLTDVLLMAAPLAADAETGPEPVHQMRVAVRRARSALSLFRRRSDPRGADPGGVAEGLRHLSQMLGPARDWDVFMTETAPPVEASLPDEAGLHALLRGGTRRRRATRAALGEFLTGAPFRRLSLELACLAATSPQVGETEPRSLVEFATGVLDAKWKKLAKAGRGLDDLDRSGLHGLRLKAKRLRYAAEFFAPMFPEKPAARFIRRLSALQERLGAFNDAASVAVLLRELNDRPGYAAGLVMGFTASSGARSRAKISSAWARFRRRQPFWT